MTQRPSGIASQINDTRGPAYQSAYQGEGVTDPNELLRLIGMIKANEAASPSGPPDMLIGEFLVSGLRVPKTFVAGLQSLTRTEAAVLRFMGWGRANSDIATLLNMSEATARSHMNRAIIKLNVDGGRELGALAGLLFHPLD